MFFRCIALILICCRPSIGSAEATALPTELVWQFSTDLATGPTAQNPTANQHGHAKTWHLLHTTRSEGGHDNRQWLRDGRYVLLSNRTERFLKEALKGWSYSHTSAPLVTRSTKDWDSGLKFKKGDLIIAPGPDHAVVVGWRSPYGGTAEIQGRFEHGQDGFGKNSQVNWYVERGPPPDPIHGFTPSTLANGSAEFGTETPTGEFQLTDLAVEPDDFIYFIVDSRADGTFHPHYGDLTRFDVKVTLRNAYVPPTPEFERDIIPILAQHCHACHGADARESGLDLRSVSAMLIGGESGSVVERGTAHASLLFQMIQSGEMPPDDRAKLSVDQLALVRRWINSGAPSSETVTERPRQSLVSEEDRQHWAFLPLKRPAVPALPADLQSLAHTAIDTFILARLDQEGLCLSPEADRRTLIRRLHLDLLGIPPAPHQVAAFLADEHPDAYARLVDQLLASPHFGERWGQHWLDVAGYTDTYGGDVDAGRPFVAEGKWRYRDYVIQAWNGDKPYNRFLAEQLAGDELANWRDAPQYSQEILDGLVATGFLRNPKDDTFADELNTPDIRYAVIFDTIEQLGTGLIGLTIHCARCHNHKFDPIPQQDYYRMMALLTPALNPHNWLQAHNHPGTSPKPRYREMLNVSAAEKQTIDQHNQHVEFQVAECQKQRDAICKNYRPQVLQEKLHKLPEPLREDTRIALETKADDRSEVQKYLAEKLGPVVAVTTEDLLAVLNDEERAQADQLQRRIDELNSTKRQYGIIQPLFDVGPPPATRMLRRGEYQKPGATVTPGFLSILDHPAGPTALTDAPAGSPTSGRRLALARWLTNPDLPAGSLVARVIVNRIWAHLMGKGIVASPGNFGHQGLPPTHPKLLDWLSIELVNGDWRMKRIIRKILLSQVYRQTSVEVPQSADPDNDLLWRMRLRRLEAEVVRDCLLAVAGQLDVTPGGPAIMIASQPSGMVIVEREGMPTPTSDCRRSVYLVRRRNYNLSMLDVFDYPVMSKNCTARSHAPSVAQSLMLLNGGFVNQQAEHLAHRVVSEAGDLEIDRIARAFELALARLPSDDEMQWCVETLQRLRERYRAGEQISAEQTERQTLANLCHSLMNTSEFLYVH